MFLISKCRGDGGLGLCTTSGLVFGEPQRSGDLPKKNVFRRRKNRFLIDFHNWGCFEPQFFSQFFSQFGLSQLNKRNGGKVKNIGDTKEFGHKRATAWLFHLGTSQNYCVTIRIAWSWSIHLWATWRIRSLSASKYKEHICFYQNTYICFQTLGAVWGMCADFRYRYVRVPMG